MPARGSNRRNPASLDAVRIRYGNERLKDAFHDATRNNSEQAARLVNENIAFPSLFVLRPEIGKANLINRLNNTNRSALDITDDILTERLEHARPREGDREALAWMLKTGSRAEGLGEHYDQVLDMAALLLAHVHKDRSCLPHVADLIFLRNRKGLYTYDLIWAFFEASEPTDLLLLADRLLSAEARDRELARELLNFVPCLREEAGPAAQHRCCVRWILRNRARLAYTGESNQQFSHPRRYALIGGDRPEQNGGNGDDQR